MVKLTPKPVKEKYEAIQWRGFANFPLGKDLLPREQEEIATSVDYVLSFDRWVKKHLKGKKFKYRGNNLVIIDRYCRETLLEPGMWIVMIPDEPGEVAIPNYLSDNYVKSAYDENSK
jgi:hypothetical protein